ncbi:MAG: transcriptional regulator [Gammaproteobacteria bacterium]|nr:transcriptional regulator [Gammaproteobacteria bacterium]MYA66598.1 transcriptional regulator [Gammaproteobacteria bacterium]MYH46095.1 transcriptional regulator [Gammaproteobacteria bacterium]MYL14661.1 transcriptional regulator [Gammaproteobacteria bacterium]
MKVETEIKKWGNSLALRVTGLMAELPGLKEGAKVVVDVSADGFVVKPVLRPAKKIELPYSERELLEDLTPSKAHVDALATPTDFEMGD